MTLTALARKYGRTRWGRPPTPSLNFFKTIFHEHLVFSVGVRETLRHNLTQVWRETNAMITRYDVIRSRSSSHF